MQKEVKSQEPKSDNKLFKCIYQSNKFFWHDYFQN